jgi:hypothetical protein
MQLVEAPFPLFSSRGQRSYGAMLFSFTSIRSTDNAPQFRFARFDKKTKEILVFAKDFDYDSRKAEIQYAIDHLALKNPEECGINVMGKSHADVLVCPNTVYDKLEGGTYCAAQKSRELTLQQEVYEWLPARIEYYWQNGIHSDQVEFLETGNFVSQYR